MTDPIEAARLAFVRRAEELDPDADIDFEAWPEEDVQRLDDLLHASRAAFHEAGGTVAVPPQRATDEMVSAGSKASKDARGAPSDEALRHIWSEMYHAWKITAAEKG